MEAKLLQYTLLHINLTLDVAVVSQLEEDDISVTGAADGVCLEITAARIAPDEDGARAISL